MWLVGHSGAVAFTAPYCPTSAVWKNLCVPPFVLCVRRLCVAANSIIDQRPMIVVSFPAYKVAICAHIITKTRAQREEL